MPDPGVGEPDRSGHLIVAMGIVASGHAGTIALEECDRRASRAPSRNRAAEFGRRRKPSIAECLRHPDERFLGERSSGRGHRRDAIGPVGS
jgi:hypothetical protein